MPASIQPFRVAIPQSDLDDLKARLGRTRWPEAETVEDWTQGVPLAQARKLVDYWTHHYDWRRCEAALNAFDQFTTEIDGLSIHFLHVRSRHPNARPMLLTHGWPGAVLEFMDVIGPLTDPTEQYVAQGGDWGAAVTTALGAQRPAGLQGIHVNMPLVMPRDPGKNLSAGESEMYEAMKDYAEWESGYSHQQSTRPQTLAYGLADSPVGQAMWIFETFYRWTGCDGDPLKALSYDQMLDIITLYSGASSGRLYWESYKNGFFAVQLKLPVGCSIFAKEIYRAPRSWAERCMSQIVYWGEVDKGGHFAALEQPERFVAEIRNWVAKLP